MPLTVTHPGRFGDLLWALPSIRALAEALGEPATLIIPGEYQPITDLLARQPYIKRVLATSTWAITQSAPITPREPPAELLKHRTGVIVHLGYKGWPALPLPFETWDLACHEQALPIALPPIELSRPWITASPWTQVPHRLVVGFTDEHFELKYGLTEALRRNPVVRALEGLTGFVLCAPESRWMQETLRESVGWMEAAQRIAAADLFLGCCSALHVLAVAMGKPVICMEPNPQRHHPIFYPLGDAGPQVTLVKGIDGLPTFDARHVADALVEVLRATPQ